MKQMKSEPATDGHFPREKVIGVLKEGWERLVSFCEEDPLDPPKPKTLKSLMNGLDSISAVEILISVESLIDVKLPSDTVRAGGYKDCTDLLNDVLPKIENRFNSKFKSTNAR